MIQDIFYNLLHDVYNILSLHRYIDATTHSIKKDFLLRNTTVAGDHMAKNFLFHEYLYPIKHGLFVSKDISLVLFLNFIILCHLLYEINFQE